VNAYPFAELADTEVLAAIHAPIVMWAVVGLAYLGGEWLPHAGRMNFVRFTGEWFVYYVLIALGGGVLTAFTAGTFFALGLDVEEFIGT
ncbi:MAG: hypothetical protein GTO05_03015, partial [Gemmatimonadales bacterium]|nr:hypothetical protein [Gemmatimonadales bacterium]